MCRNSGQKISGPLPVYIPGPSVQKKFAPNQPPYSMSSLAIAAGEGPGSPGLWLFWSSQARQKTASWLLHCPWTFHINITSNLTMYMTSPSGTASHQRTFFHLSYSSSISVYARPCMLLPKHSPLRHVASMSTYCTVAGPPTHLLSCSFQFSRILAYCSHQMARCRHWKQSNTSVGNPFWMLQQMPPLHAHSKELLLLIHGMIIRNGCVGDGWDFSWFRVAQRWDFFRH